MEWLAQWAAYVPAAVPPGTSAAGLEPAADGEAADALLPSDPAASQPVDLASTDAAQAGPVQGAAPQPGLAAGITPPRGAGNAAKAVAARSDDVEPASRQPAPASERASAVPAAPAVPGAAQAAPAAEPRPAPGVLQDTATVPVNGIAHTHASSPRIDLPSAPGAPTPLQQGALQERIDGALRWMAAGNLQAAQLRVDPDALGPITIHLRLDGDIANVAFGSNHEATRQALESALPGLKDALQAGGLSLGQASVGSEQQGFSQARQFDEPAGRSARGASGDGAAAGHASAASSVEAQIPRRSGDRLLDAYA
ncbi:Flagellar hook-length control protein [Pigmentiphaga humi]|uniref:Flagellar hook-length control protein n=2 Tax=Pigmentiphaga humi TaxID=2478468 RepID=A0A3P4B2R9_9BURK|nr:Flagellar hook-length control protein [Pigmentiphaga humi]